MKSLPLPPPPYCWLLPCAPLIFQGAYGDRRQELVFIGLGVNEPVTRSLIYSALDDSLLTDAEMALYEDVRGVRKLLMMVLIIMRAAVGKESIFLVFEHLIGVTDDNCRKCHV